MNPMNRQRPLEREAIRNHLMAVLFLLMALYCFLFPDLLCRVTFQESLRRQSAALVDDSLKTSIAVFGSLSAIKGVVYMLEGSSVGVGVDLEIGDFVQPATDYIDFLWRAFLWVIVVLSSYKLLLDTDLLQIGVYLVGLGLTLHAASIIRRWLGPRPLPARPIVLRLWARRCVLIGLFSVYVVPASLIVAHAVSSHYTEPFKQTQRRRMELVEKRFEIAQQQFLDLKGQISIMAPRATIENLGQNLMNILRTTSHLAIENAWGFLLFVLAVLFEKLILPVLTALALYRVARYSWIAPAQPLAPGTPDPIP